MSRKKPNTSARIKEGKKEREISNTRGDGTEKVFARTQTYPPELLVTKNILTDGTDHVIVSVEVNVALLVRHRT